MLASLVFASLHPAAGFVPVFVLGLATAWAFERTGGLLAPMLTHAAYNCAVAAVPLLGS